MKEFFVGNYFLGIYYTFLLLFRWKIDVEYVDFFRWSCLFKWSLNRCRIRRLSLNVQLENRCSWKIDVDVDVEYVDGKSMQNMQIFFNGV